MRIRIFSDDEVYSDTDDGEYFSTDESLEGILDFGTFKRCPCTVVSFQEKHSDPSAILRSSEVPDRSDKWEDVDLGSFCVSDEMPLEFFDQDVMFFQPYWFCWFLY